MGLSAVFACTPAKDAADSGMDGDGGAGAGQQNGGGGQNGGQDDNGGAGDGGAPDVVPTPPVLESAVARQVGRFGKDVRVDVTGSDEAGDATSLRVTLLDGTGAALTAFDSDGDGTLDTNETVLPLELVTTGETAVSSFVTLPFFHELYPQLEQLGVSLVDAAGAESEAMMISLTDQPVLSLDQLCDGAFVENRCADGLGCKGDEPKVCTEGTAPALKQVAYLEDELGRRVLVDGSDDDQDVVSYTLEFLDGTDQPVMMDLDGDGKDDASSFTGDVDVVGTEAQFFIQFQPSEAFVALVSKVAVTVKDLGQRESTREVAVKKAAVARSPGASCDPRGFDRCTTNNVCSPGVVGEQNRCTAVGAARTKACASALVLKPGAGIDSVQGEIASLSVWDSPSGCSTNDPKLRPEAVVKLVLDAPAEKVTLSTDNSYTNFDTTLYALSECNAMPVVAWCADDQVEGARPQLAVLELNDLDAGEYFVVVDSFPSSSTGTRFQLDVTIQE